MILALVMLLGTETIALKDQATVSGRWLSIESVTPRVPVVAIFACAAR